MAARGRTKPPQAALADRLYGSWMRLPVAGRPGFRENVVTADRPLITCHWSPSMSSPAIAEAVARRSQIVLALALMAALAAATAVMPAQARAFHTAAPFANAAR